MLGVPSEIYSYGTQYWLIIVPVILMAFVVSRVYLPVFSALNVGSSYEVCIHIEVVIFLKIRRLTRITNKTLLIKNRTQDIFAVLI